LIHAFETGGDKERLSVALALQQAQQGRAGPTFEQRGLGGQVVEIQSRLVIEKIEWKALA
jgi:hypothetical protein